MSSYYAAYDEYGLRHLPKHLMRSGRGEILREMLHEFDWLQVKLDATEVDALIVDYDIALTGSKFGAEGKDARDEDGLFLVRAALRLSANVLRGDKTQLAGQLVGRLLTVEDPAIQKLLGEARAWRGTPWLMPLSTNNSLILKRPGGPLVCALPGHLEAVNAVAFSADGTLAVSASKDHTLCVWDLNKQECVHTLMGHTDEVNAALVISTAQELIAVSGAGKPLPFKMLIQFPTYIKHMDTRPSYDTSIRIWDLHTGSQLKKLEGHTGAVRCLAAHEKLLFSGSDDGTIRIWDLEKKTSLGVLGNHGHPVVLLAVVYGGSGIRSFPGYGIMSFSEYDFKLWARVAKSLPERLFGFANKPPRQATWQNLGSGNFDRFWMNVLAVDSDRLLFAMQRSSPFMGDTYDLLIWDIPHSKDNNEKIDKIAGFESSFNTARFLDDGRHVLIGGTDQTIRLIDMKSGEEVRRYEGHKGEITSIDVVTKTARMLSASSDGVLMLWDLDAPQESATGIGHSDDVNAVAISRDGRHAISGSYDCSIIVWNIRDGSRLQAIGGHRQSVTGIAISSDGERALSCSNDKTVRLWNVKDGAELLMLTGHEAAVKCVMFNHEEDLAISGSDDGALKVWDLALGRERFTLQGHKHGIRALALLHHDNVAVSGDESGRLVFWDLQGGRKLVEVDHFSDDARYLKRDQVPWDVSTGPQWPLSSMEKYLPAIESLAITPDDQFFVVALRNSPIILWDIEQKTAHTKFSGHSGIVFGVAVSPNGQRLVSASDDNTLRVWDLVTGVHLCTFTADSSLYCCAIGPDSKTIVAGEGGRSGRIHFLRVEALDR